MALISGTAQKVHRNWEVVVELAPVDYIHSMKFLCHISQKDGLWTVEHASQNVGPIRVSADTREEALRKMDGEIHYWLEMCPCSGQAYRDLEIELVEAS
jgi:hypothetical protein